MVAVILDQRECSPLARRHFAVALEPPADTLELGQRLEHSGIRNIELDRNGNRRQRIEHVVAAGQVQHHVQVRQDDTVAALHSEVHLCAGRSHIDGAHLRVFGKTVAGDRTGDLGHDVAHRRIVGTKNGGAVERHAVQEVDERRFQPVEVVPVGLHVVGVDIGHDRHDRQQVQERGVRFVGLHHDVVAAAQPGVGADAVEASADHEGRVQPGFGQHARHQAGGGCLAVGAGDRDALFQAHQFGQHQRARNHRDAFAPGFQHLGVVGVDSGGRDHRVGAVYVGRVVAGEDPDPQFAQAAQRGTGGKIGTRDGVAQVEQHLGDTRHAGAADADEVDVFDRVFHSGPVGIGGSCQFLASRDHVRRGPGLFQFPGGYGAGQ